MYQGHTRTNNVVKMYYPLLMFWKTKTKKNGKVNRLAIFLFKSDYLYYNNIIIIICGRV